MLTPVSRYVGIPVGLALICFGGWLIWRAYIKRAIIASRLETAKGIKEKEEGRAWQNFADYIAKKLIYREMHL